MSERTRRPKIQISKTDGVIADLKTLWRLMPHLKGKYSETFREYAKPE